MENIEINIFDNIEYYFNCAVEVITNYITGQQSIGWAKIDSPIVKFGKN